MEPKGDNSLYSTRYSKYLLCIAALLADGNAFTHTHHHVTHNTFVGLAIKANDFVAEFFEFSIGKAL